VYQGVGIRLRRRTGMRARNLAGHAIVGMLVTALWISWVAPLASAQPLSWSKLAPVPSRGRGVEGMSVALVGDLIVAAYGYSNGDTRATRIYSIKKDRWTSGVKAPGPQRSEGTAVADELFVYSIGGRQSNGRLGVVGDLDRYSPRDDKWTSLPDMPTPRAGLASAIVGHSIYAIGGRRGPSGPCSQQPGGQFAKVERYDIGRRRWTEVAPMPVARSDIGAAVVDGRIFVFGGCKVTGSSHVTYLDRVDVYDPTTNSWNRQPADMPTARAGMYAVATLGGKIVVPGGWAGGEDPLGVVEIYSVRHDSWERGPRMLTPRAEMGVVSRGGFVFAVGGAQPAFGASVNSNEVLGPG
jgi:N-acetylneuraminic acid mutarotase